jgi:hypothetical protein
MVVLLRGGCVMRDVIEDVISAGLAFLLAGSFGALCYKGYEEYVERSEFAEACEERGGYAVEGRGGLLCLDRAVVIEL